ncbi:exocyst complex component protein [Tremella mesenterica]|uniref:Exocyst complex component protein n=1 Tax=Tremella mesenterica TaxID=5217 RepID=A0A4Q1BIF2_TREME|nr:exocyst complex component protein [Tremella mesenterica]
MSFPETPPKRPDRRPPQPTPLRPRDPAIDRALQLSTFESNYSTDEFVATLSDKLIAQSKATSGPFDPKPFLQTFSPALDSLLGLRAQVAERTKRMETEVRRAEREYGRRLRELDGGFEAIGNSFSSLESKITDVGQTAVRIGEQLESLHQTRSTAQSTSLLLSYYLSLVHITSTTPDPNNPKPETTNPLEQLFATRTSREGRARISIILRRLMAVAKDRRTEKEKAERVRDEVERYCERFEKECLRLFDRSYRKGDPRMMAHCAKTLQDFNGGASCVQIYVNQHDFFISKDRVLEDAAKGDGDETRIDIWSTIGDPDSPPPTSEPGMEALFKEIRSTVAQEAQIVKAVFPSPIAVMQVFLQRIFAQVIQQHLESLVSRASTISTLAVLRILSMVHSTCSTLVEDLKTYDATLSGSMGSLGTSSMSVSVVGTASGTGPLAVMLDHALEEIFVPWLEGSRYLESETKNLVELYAGLLSRFTRYHETVLKAKPNSLLDKVVHQLSSSSSAATSSSTAQAAAAAMSKYANMFTASAERATKALQTSSQPPYQLPGSQRTSQISQAPGSKILRGTDSPKGAVTPLGKPEVKRQDSMRGELVNRGLEDKVWSTDGVLTVEMSERMLKWHAEAVGRIVELSSSGEVHKSAFALSRTLAEAIGRSFVETALDSALARLDQQDPKSEPDLSPLAVLKPADLIFHLWQRYATTALLPLAGSTATSRREIGSLNSHGVMRMEGKVNAVIQRGLDLILGWISQLLTKQKKNDYKPKNDELSFARTTTEPCELICEFLGTVKEVVDEGLSGKNAEVFLTELGVAFHSLLLDHYKKFPVNPTGGLMLTKDLATYQETVASFAVPAINDRFDMLRQLGNSFIVQPHVLKSYMTESHLGRIELSLLRPYLQQRSDYSTFSRSLNLDSDDTVGSTVIASTSSHSHVHGGGGGKGMFNNRFSTMSGVAGAGMGKLREMLRELEGDTEEERKKRKEKLDQWDKDHPKSARLPPQAWQPMPLYYSGL